MIVATYILLVVLQSGVHGALCVHVSIPQGFLKLTKSCSHFPKILLTSAFSKAGYKGNNGKNGYSIQGLVAKVKGTLANG